MAARSTEAPTAQRLAEARRRGEIAVSADLTAAGATVAGALALIALGPALWRGAVELARAQWARALSGGDLAGAGWTALRAAAAGLAPVLAAALAGAVGFGILQTRGAVVAPRGRIARAGDGQGLALLLAMAKLAIVGAVAWATLRSLAPAVVGLVGASPERTLIAFGRLAARLAGRLALVLLVLGVADYAVRWLVTRRSLRMTPEEIKRQRRETEGDERLRSRRRQIQRTPANH